MNVAHPLASQFRRRAVAVASTAALGAGVFAFAPTASAVPEVYASAVTGEIAVKGAPSAFSGVTIAGDYDSATGDITGTAVFPPTSLLKEAVLGPTLNAEVGIQVSQPTPGSGTIVDGVANFDAEFKIVITYVNLINVDTGDVSPLPLGPTPDSCAFGPIAVDLVGTASTGSDGVVTVDVADDAFTIPAPEDPADCGGLGTLIIPNVAGPAEGEPNNTANLSFKLSNDGGVINANHESVLDRTADVGGLAYWSGKLASGTSPATIATMFAQTEEGWSRAVIDSYWGVLDRGPEAAGLKYWTRALRANKDQPFLVGQLAASPEVAEMAETEFPEASYTGA